MPASRDTEVTLHAFAQARFIAVKEAGDFRVRCVALLPVRDPRASFRELSLRTARVKCMRIHCELFAGFPDWNTHGTPTIFVPDLINLGAGTDLLTTGRTQDEKQARSGKACRFDDVFGI